MHCPVRAGAAGPLAVWREAEEVWAEVGEEWVGEGEEQVGVECEVVGVWGEGLPPAAVYPS